MISKRGLTQADWVISIGIFLIYLAWFFVVIGPVLGPETKESLPADELKEAFMVNASWQVNVTPIILRSNLSSGSEPVIIDFPFSGNAVNYAVKETYWNIEDKRLVFLASFARSPVIYSLVHSTYNYTKPSIASNMAAGDSAAESAYMKANFDESLLERARYHDSLRIAEFNMDVAGEPINTLANEFSSSSISVRYKIRTPTLNNTYYIFENNSRIYCYIDTTEEKPVLLNFRLHEYDRYYVDSQEHGTIVYNITECDNFESNFIDFLDDDYGLAFIFSEDIDLKMCHDNTLELNASAAVDGSFNYIAVFHSAETDASSLISPYSAVFGATNVIEGLSGEKMLHLRSQNYSDLKEDWNMGHDFNITVFNSTKAFLRIGKPPYRDVNVHSKQWYVWILDEYANQTRVALNILMW